MLIILALIFFAPQTQAAVLPPSVPSAHYEFTYQTVFYKPSHTFTKWEAWIPFPAQNLEQKVVSYKFHSPLPVALTRELHHGNMMIHLVGSAKTQFPVNFEATYEIQRSDAGIIPAKLLPKRWWNPQDFLQPDKLIPITGKIARIAAKQVRGAKNDNQKIHRLFKYVVRTMTYSKVGKGWGNGDAIWACDNKRGNCTDFHSLFIALARSQKIPARFEIGFPIAPSQSGEVSGYHCWARAFDPKAGWIPLDASEAKNHGKMFEYLGQLPDDRIQFTAGRDLVLNPPQHGSPLNYFIYPYVEVDGVASNNYQKHFYAKRL